MITDRIDVFLSRKSQDAHLAKEVYDFLTSKGLQVFDSDHSLLEMGNSDYSRAIDDALVKTNHLIVIGSSIENITSSWVEAEWRFFLNRKRAGKIKGNILTVITKDVAIDDLPPSLQNYEVIPFEKKNEKILPYVMVGHIKTPIVEEKVIEPIVIPVPEIPKIVLKEEIKKVEKPIMPVPEKPKTVLKEEVKKIEKPVVPVTEKPKTGFKEWTEKVEKPIEVNNSSSKQINSSQNETKKQYKDFLFVLTAFGLLLLFIYSISQRKSKKEEYSVVDSVAVDTTMTIDTTIFTAVDTTKTKDYSPFSDIESEQKAIEGEIFTMTEQMAEFTGDMGTFAKFLQMNLKYPAAAQRANVQGKVYIQFVVNTDGSIQNIDVLKPLGFGCDEEAIRVIKSFPRWTPAKQSGRLVRSRFTIPISFQLSE
jgi:TonB family protein